MVNLILKATSRRKAEAPCDLHPTGGSKASWEVDFGAAGRMNLCKFHYRSLTQWECENCERPNYGMTFRCVCGWVRPDVCRKCGQISAEPLIKIVSKKEGHPCHACGGDGRARGFVPCPSCNGRVRMGERECCSCFGVGLNAEKGTRCTSCDGLGKTAIICGGCKGVGEIFVRHDEACSACDGGGICRDSSARWNLDRIALSDIHPEHQEEFRKYAGQYLCFRCANPDFSFGSFQNEGEELRQCSHHEETPEGPVQCKNLLARSNPESFCYRHSKAHLCEVCGQKLKLDEWGRRCRDHAKCARCDEKPLPGAILCGEHTNYKALGRVIEKHRVPETPVQILNAQERVDRAIEALARRRESAKGRAQENTVIQRKLEQEVYEIVLRDPQQNEWRREEIDKIRTQIGQIGQLDPKEADEADRLEEEIEGLERQMDEAREFDDRVKMRILRGRIGKLEKYIEEDLNVFVRYSRIGTELQDLAKRLEELRHYELWEPKGTPQFTVSEDMECFQCKTKFDGPECDWTCPKCGLRYHKSAPYYIFCKKCGGMFNARATKWLCPDCTTAEAVPMADGRIHKSADDIVAIVHLPTDNRPQLPHEWENLCEVCGRRVDYRLKATRLYRPDKPVDGVVEWKVYFACNECRSEKAEDLIRRDQERLRKIQESEVKALSSDRVRLFIKDCIRRVDEREREALGLPPIPKEKSSAFFTRPHIRELPRQESRSEMEKRVKAEAAAETRNELDRAHIHYAQLIGKDELTEEERKEAHLLRSTLISGITEMKIKYSEALGRAEESKKGRNKNRKEAADLKQKIKEEEDKLVRKLDRAIPPPPPSRWGLQRT